MYTENTLLKGGQNLYTYFFCCYDMYFSCLTCLLTSNQLIHREQLLNRNNRTFYCVVTDDDKKKLKDAVRKDALKRLLQPLMNR